MKNTSKVSASKMPVFGLAAIAAAILFALAACGGGDSSGDSTILFSAQPDDPENTFAINFSFTSDVSDLTANEIIFYSIDPLYNPNIEIGSATKGELTGSGRNWSLKITVENSGNIFVRINKKGIEGWGKETYRSVRVAKPKQTKADGSVWTYLETSANSFNSIFNYSSIVYGGGKFVAGTFENRISYSSDGIAWTHVAEILKKDNYSYYSNSIDGIAYGSNKFVAVGGNYDYGIMAYSSDGVIWTAITNSTFDTSRIKAIAYGGNMFVAGGVDGKMAYSSDGVAWTAVTSKPFDYTIDIIAYGSGKFVANGVNYNSEVRIHLTP